MSYISNQVNVGNREPHLRIKLGNAFEAFEGEQPWDESPQNLDSGVLESPLPKFCTYCTTDTPTTRGTDVHAASTETPHRYRGYSFVWAHVHFPVVAVCCSRTPSTLSLNSQPNESSTIKLKHIFEMRNFSSHVCIYYCSQACSDSNFPCWVWILRMVSYYHLSPTWNQSLVSCKHMTLCFLANQFNLTSFQGRPS